MEWKNYKKINIINNKIKNIQIYEEKFIIGKSNLNSKNFDVLLIAPKDMKSVKIPSFIKIISEYAFYESSIESIYIPSNVTHICDHAFSICLSLKKLNLQKIQNSSKLMGLHFLIL